MCPYLCPRLWLWELAAGWGITRLKLVTYSRVSHIEDIRCCFGTDAKFKLVDGVSVPVVTWRSYKFVQNELTSYLPSVVIIKKFFFFRCNLHFCDCIFVFFALLTTTTTSFKAAVLTWWRSWNRTSACAMSSTERGRKSYSKPKRKTRSVSVTNCCCSSHST